MSNHLWTSTAIAQATQGQCSGDFAVSGLCIDSREVQAGDLFVALHTASDGHDYAAQALQDGAAGALVHRVPDGVDTDKLIVVDDTTQALEALAIAARTRTHARVVAVTGSAGKTGTKEQLRTIFQAQGPTHAAVRSFNNHVGVPLTLARMPAETDFGVMEIGMNHPGEIVPLSKLCAPDVALITTVAPVHLAAFDDVSGIAREKASIFKGLQNGGVAVIPRDNDFYDVLRDEAHNHGASSILTFGENAESDARLISCDIHDDKTVAKAHILGQDILFKFHGFGKHLALNALGALLAAHACGVDLAKAALALSDWQPPSGRGDRWQVHLSEDTHFTLIDDSYNANPASMQASLGVLAHTKTTGRRIAVLTDMLELGPQERDLHRALGDLQAIDSIDQFYLAGPCMQALYDDALPAPKQGAYAPTAATLIDALPRTRFRAGDTILVKGSNGSHAHKIANHLKSLGVARPAHHKEDTL